MGSIPARETRPVNLYLRLLIVLARARLGTSLGPLDVARTPFRVWPHDLDLNGHMNNGRYATLMDLGRMDLMARAGLLRRILGARMHPVVTAQHLLYRRSLDPFAAFVLETEVIGWDERFVYMEQRFVRDGRLHARGLMQALFLGPRGRVGSAELLVLFGIEGERPVPRDVAAMFPPPPADLARAA